MAMARGAIDGRDLHMVVALNEGAKEMVRLSFQVNLRALDARVRSMQAKGDLRGFDEVSTQMRRWSVELSNTLGRVAQECAEAVKLASQSAKQTRELRLLRQAAAACDSPALAHVVVAAQDRLDTRNAAKTRLFRSLRNLLEDLEQQGLMAVVLSRSALIEAASANDRGREALGQVSQEFADDAEAVSHIVRSLLRRTATTRHMETYEEAGHHL